jgi:hypothetical protein
MERNLEESILVHYEVDFGKEHLSISKNELLKMIHESEKIHCISKAYTFSDKSSRWIVLFGDDTPVKDKDGNIGYWTYSNERYGTNVMDDSDKEMMQRWLDIRLPLLRQKKNA